MANPYVKGVCVPGRGGGLPFILVPCFKRCSYYDEIQVRGPLPEGNQ